MKINLTKNYLQERGFTLIELLVVIGILGILAAALVATIDPFEQLKKANDANVKNTAVEFTDANIRYYTTHNAMPWAVDSDTSVAGSCASEVGSKTGPAATVNLSSLAGVINGGVGTGCLADIIADGELKAAFTSATGVLSQILIVGDTNSVTACFAPSSKAQQNDINTKYTYAAGKFSVNDRAIGSSNGCVNGSYAAGTLCYWCAQ